MLCQLKVVVRSLVGSRFQHFWAGVAVRKMLQNAIRDPRFMKLVKDLIVGDLDASAYEDACRALLGEWLHR